LKLLPAITGIVVNAVLPGNNFKFTSSYASGKKKHK